VTTGLRPSAGRVTRAAAQRSACSP
jgi:hypothetical protein